MKLSYLLSVFLFFLSVYLIFSNQRITTSMDVDVVRYASEYAESGSYGSEFKLSSGVAFSPKTGLFYPLEGIGIVVPLAVFSIFSDLISPDSQFVLFTFNQVFSALAVLFIFLSLALFMSRKKAFFYASLFGFGTPLFVHSKYLLPEPLTLMAVAGALYFLLRFRHDGKALWLFISGLFSGFSLLARPDAPIFAVLFFFLAIYASYRSGRHIFVKSSIFLALGFSIFTTIFFISNYQRYGSFMETGYTLNRQEIISELEKNIPEIYQKAAAAYQKDQSSKETAQLVQKLQSQQKFLEDMKKIESEIGDENTAFSTNGFSNFVNGIYLILLSPNRSIFFLSPFLFILFLGLPSRFKRFKWEFIFAGLMIAGYLSLYALRAPLSYAGSAAWGVRYLLPVYPVFFLSVILFERSEYFKKRAVKKLFYILCAISVIFQVAGSAVNYQSVQMPLEYKSKQIYGTDDMTWAHKSRESMMTDFSSSLLLNNSRIMLGILTPGQEEYGVETGPNDWFFLQVLKGEGMLVRGKENALGNFKLIFLMLLLMAGGSLYFIKREFFKKDALK
jgi:hypothetical protein